MRKYFILINVTVFMLFIVACGGGVEPEAVIKLTASEPLATDSLIASAESGQTYGGGMAVDVITEKIKRNGSYRVMQSVLLDLDGDGTEEQIAVYFSDHNITVGGNVPPEDIYCDFSEIEITADGGKKYTSSWFYDNMEPQINFADFDTRDKAVQFYFYGDGPSGDPYTQIFSFDGTRIVENTGFPGEITGCDGQGRIYSGNINSYYDLVDGLTPLPKENIVGTEIQRDINILLYSKPGEGYTSAIISDSYTYEESLEDHIEPF